MDNLNHALQITGIGMAGIFIFMGIFYGCIILLDKFFPQEIKSQQE